MTFIWGIFVWLTFSESLKFETSPFQIIRLGFTRTHPNLISPSISLRWTSDQKLTRPSKLFAPLFPVDDDCLKLSRTSIISTKNLVLGRSSTTSTKWWQFLHSLRERQRVEPICFHPRKLAPLFQWSIAGSSELSRVETCFIQQRDAEDNTSKTLDHWNVG